MLPWTWAYKDVFESVFAGLYGDSAVGFLKTPQAAFHSVTSLPVMNSLSPHPHQLWFLPFFSRTMAANLHGLKIISPFSFSLGALMSKIWSIFYVLVGFFGEISMQVLRSFSARLIVFLWFICFFSEYFQPSCPHLLVRLSNSGLS